MYVDIAVGSQLVVTGSSFDKRAKQERRGLAGNVSLLLRLSCTLPYSGSVQRRAHRFASLGLSLHQEAASAALCSLQTPKKSSNNVGRSMASEAQSPGLMHRWNDQLTAPFRCSFVPLSRLFLFAVIMSAVLLFTSVFFIIMFSDLECVSADAYGANPACWPGLTANALQTARTTSTLSTSATSSIKWA